MTFDMDVDGKEKLSPVMKEGGISVHPLAIVNMSDQYTRISCGGTPLDKKAPVTGLLFGTYSNNCDADKTQEYGGIIKTPMSAKKKNAEAMFNHQHLHIRDAGADIPIDVSDNAKKQVLLHQAVFSHHRVVGWYRVISPLYGSSSDDTEENYEPTLDDLQITQQLKQYYWNEFTNDDGDDISNETSKKQDHERCRFIFATLQVKQESTNVNDKNYDNEKPATKEEEMKQEDDELPVTLYQLHGDDTNPVLLGLDHWKLITSESERIAVERVVCEEQQQQRVTTDSNKNNLSNISTNTAGNNKNKKEMKNKKNKNKNNSNEAKTDNHNNNSSSNSRCNSGYVSSLNNVQHSLLCMDERVKVIIDYLTKVKSGSVPVNRSLLRHINSLVLQLGPLCNNNDTGRSGQQQHIDAELISQLAVIGKTIHSAQGYTEKFRQLYENRISSFPTGGNRGNSSGPGAGNDMVMGGGIQQQPIQGGMSRISRY